MKFSKIFASFLLASTMAINSGALVSNAEEVPEVSQIPVPLEIDSMSDEQINEYILSFTDESTSTGDYADFDSYSDGNLSYTPHYMAVMGKKISACKISFVFSPSACGKDCTSNSNFTVNCPGVRLNVNQSGNLLRMGVYEYEGTVSGSYSYSNMHELIKCKIIPDIGAVSSENLLHLYTSRMGNGDMTFQVNNSNLTFYKTIYSMGDVDRNGRVEPADTLLINKYVAGILDQTQYYDDKDDRLACNLLAFQLAADVTHDGNITSDDVNLLNRAILGQATLT